MEVVFVCGSKVKKEYRKSRDRTDKHTISTNLLSKRSMMRSHPVSGNSGPPMLLGKVLGVGMGAGAGLVEEEEEGEGICAGWAAATSAAWTLGSRKQKGGGLALWMRPCSRPVLRVPWGAESACRLRRAKPVLDCSGCITLQLALGCSREAETHGHGLGCCTHCFDLSSILKTNSLKASEILAQATRAVRLSSCLMVQFYQNTLGT